MTRLEELRQAISEARRVGLRSRERVERELEKLATADDRGRRQLAYQQVLALEQREEELGRSMRKRYDEAAQTRGGLL